jgi:Protein of unknown function (DUF998)
VSSKRAKSFSLAVTMFSALFLVLLAALHGLKPEFDPTWRMISEYALGRYGAVMELAFVCWSASVASLALALWSSLRGASGSIARGWLLLLSVALIGAATFTTSPLTNLTLTPAHKLHQLCGTLVIFTFPIAASLAVKSLRANDEWASRRRALLHSLWLPWLGLLGFFASLIVFRLLHPELGRVGPHMAIGVSNRALVVSDHGWLLLLAAWVRRG